MLFRGEKVNKVECKPGLVFNNRGEYYILAYVAPQEVALVSLTDGNRWRDAVCLPGVSNNCMRLSRDEWALVAGPDKEKLTPVTGNFITGGQYH